MIFDNPPMQIKQAYISARLFISNRYRYARTATFINYFNSNIFLVSVKLFCAERAVSR